MPHNFIALLALCLSLNCNADLVLRSGEKQNTLLELYTSEGCSSCPAADRWFSTLREHPDLWRTLVPVVFHVDYWDYLGWEDRFADPSHAVRQRRYQREGGSRAVYTPGVFASGQEWRNWRSDPDRMPEETAKTGVLALTTDGGGFSASFTEYTDRGARRRILNLAVLGFGLKTPVRAGENRGAVLEHDFVVLGHRQYATLGDNWQGTLPGLQADEKATDYALVAWVSNADQQRPLQAVGAWFESHPYRLPALTAPRASAAD